MNLYETVFILTPVLSDDQAKEAVQKVEKEIKSLGGKVQHTENWGLRKMAYPIQKKSTGFYFLVEFSALVHW
jgi:small subunit ribosomal protein S6